MIIPTGDSIYQKFFLIIDKKYSTNQFLRVAGVEENSYAGRLIKRIYDCLRIGNVNVIDEYNKYYLPEYSDLGDFLYRKYNCSKSTIEIILKGIDKDKILEYGNLESGGDYNLGQFIMSEQILDKINEFLK